MAANDLNPVIYKALPQTLKRSLGNARLSGAKAQS